MTRFNMVAEIAAPPTRAWAVMSDVVRRPEWTSAVTSVKPIGPGRLAAGQLVLIRQPKLPPAVWQVTEIDEGAGFTWFNRNPGVLVIARHGVEPAAGGSLGTLSIEFHGPLGPIVARLTRRLIKRYLAVEAEGLKRTSESLANCAAALM